MAVPLILGLASLGMGAYQMAKAAKDKKKAEEEMKKAMAKRPDYQVSQSIKDQLADTRSRVNSVDPSIQLMQQQAQKQAAGTQANAQRNATSGAEALAVGSAAQGQLQSMLPQMAMLQRQNQQQNLGNYYNAQGAMANQDLIRAQDQQAKNSDMVNFALGKIGAASANMSSGISNAVGGVLGAAQGLGQMKNPNFNNGQPSANTQAAFMARNKDFINPTPTAQMQQFPVQNPQVSLTQQRIANPMMAQYIPQNNWTYKAGQFYQNR